MIDANGLLQLGIAEAEATGSDGGAVVDLSVSFVTPSGQSGSLAAPLLGLTPVVNATGGTLAGGANYFYAVSVVDSAGGESSLSFTAQVNTSADGNTNSVVLDQIALPVGAVSFHVYRGLNPEVLFRIASNQTTAPIFMDTGLAPETVLPPDAQFDHGMCTGAGN